MSSFFQKGFQQYSRKAGSSGFKNSSFFNQSSKKTFSTFSNQSFNFQMQALRARASYSLLLSMNQSLMINPELCLSLTEEDGEDEDALLLRSSTLVTKNNSQINLYESSVPLAQHIKLKELCFDFKIQAVPIRARGMTAASNE
eukprot:403366386